MKKTRLALIVVFLIVTGTLLGQDVRYNFDKNTDFSKYKTYKWVALKDAARVNDIADKQIKDAVDSQLATKGLSKVDADDADLYIGYQVGMSTEKQFTSFDSGWGAGPGWYRGGWYGGGMGGMATGSTSTIYIGQLALDMNDRTKKELVWRGVVSKTIDPRAKPDKQTKNLNKAIAKLMRNYPPKTK